MNDFDVRQFQDPQVIQKALTRKHIAVVGLSANELRASNFVGRYMKFHGYEVIPVNPKEKSILGVTCWPSLSAIPNDQKIDVVDVFRHPSAVPEIAREAVSIGAEILWTQFGIVSEEGAEIAKKGGLDVVMDRCLKVEHARYLGRMHWFGLNTGRISAQNQKTVGGSR